MRKKGIVLIALAVVFLSVSAVSVCANALANSNSEGGYIVYIGNEEAVLAYYHSPDGHRYCLNWSIPIPTDAFGTCYGVPK